MAKRNSKKKPQRTRAQISPVREWKPGSAGRNVVAILNELLERYPGNPFVEYKATEDMQRNIPALTQLYIEQGADSVSASRTALDRLGYAGPLDVPDLPSEVARNYQADIAAGLQDVTPYVVSPSMHATVLAAAHTLDHLDLATLASVDELPSSRGFVLMPTHVPLTALGGDGDAVIALRAVSWKVATMHSPDHDEPRLGVHLTGWEIIEDRFKTALLTWVWQSAERAGTPMPRLIPTVDLRLFPDPDRNLTEADRETALEMSRRATELQFGDLTAHSDAASVVGQVLGDLAEPIPNDDNDFAGKYAYAFWRLCAQKIATAEPTPAGTFEHVRPRQVTAEQVAAVRVIELRATATEPEPNQKRDVNWKHRWVVSMHKVRQWYPKEQVHKIIWRGPYIKGPDGAPLLTGEKVRALIK